MLVNQESRHKSHETVQISSKKLLRDVMIFLSSVILGFVARVLMRNYYLRRIMMNSYEELFQVKKEIKKLKTDVKIIEDGLLNADEVSAKLIE